VTVSGARVSLHHPQTMADTAFRRIDVDKLEEDVLLATELYDPDPRGPDGALADAKAKVGQVRTALSK
jgi:actin related protein 2/3 complex subunit 5